LSLCVRNTNCITIIYITTGIIQDVSRTVASCVIKAQVYMPIAQSLINSCFTSHTISVCDFYMYCLTSVGQPHAASLILVALERCCSSEVIFNGQCVARWRCYCRSRGVAAGERCRSRRLDSMYTFQGFGARLLLTTLFYITSYNSIAPSPAYFMFPSDRWLRLV